MESLSLTFMLTDEEQKEITQVIARLDALLSAHPEFLPFAYSFLEHKNRILKREERARVCTEDPRYMQPATPFVKSTQLTRTLIKAGTRSQSPDDFRHTSDSEHRLENGQQQD